MKRPVPAILLLPAMLVLFACNQTPPPADETQPRQPVFNTARAVAYADYYKAGGLDLNVVSLDLYSEGITLDSAGLMHGTGTNLYFSDIFLPVNAVRLEDGIYQTDSVILPMTFLRGADYEGSITGAYILTIAEDELTSITLIPDGQFEVTTVADSTFIEFNLHYKENYRQQEYKARFNGIIEYE